MQRPVDFVIAVRAATNIFTVSYRHRRRNRSGHSVCSTRVRMEIFRRLSPNSARVAAVSLVVMLSVAAIVLAAQLATSG
jgi:hypothetical protein